MPIIIFNLFFNNNLKSPTSLLKSMSSATRPSVLSSISTPFETTEEYFDEKEEYISLLTSRQHFVKLDIKKDEKKDTRSVRKSRGRLAKTVTV